MGEAELATPLGPLRITEVFVEHDGPRVCACECSTGQLYVGLWVVEEPQLHEWLLLPVSQTRLSAIRTGEITLREAILHAEDGWLWHVSYPLDGQQPSARRVKGEDVSGDQLPGETFRLSRK